VFFALNAPRVIALMPREQITPPGAMHHGVTSP